MNFTHWWRAHKNKKRKSDAVGRPGLPHLGFHKKAKVKTEVRFPVGWGLASFRNDFIRIFIISQLNFPCHSRQFRCAVRFQELNRDLITNYLRNLMSKVSITGRLSDQGINQGSNHNNLITFLFLKRNLVMMRPAQSPTLYTCLVDNLPERNVNNLLAENAKPPVSKPP